MSGPVQDSGGHVVESKRGWHLCCMLGVKLVHLDSLCVLHPRIPGGGDFEELMKHIPEPWRSINLDWRVAIVVGSTEAANEPGEAIHVIAMEMSHEYSRD